MGYFLLGHNKSVTRSGSLVTVWYSQLRCIVPVCTMNVMMCFYLVLFNNIFNLLTSNIKVTERELIRCIYIYMYTPRNKYFIYEK